MRHMFCCALFPFFLVFLAHWSFVLWRRGRLGMLMRGVMGERVVRLDYIMTYGACGTSMLAIRNIGHFNLLGVQHGNAASGEVQFCVFSLAWLFPSRCVVVDIGGYGRCLWGGWEIHARVSLVVACNEDGSSPGYELTT
jgi:hypothetical protein